MLYKVRLDGKRDTTPISLGADIEAVSPADLKAAIYELVAKALREQNGTVFDGICTVEQIEKTVVLAAKPIKVELTQAKNIVTPL